MSEERRFVEEVTRLVDESRMTQMAFGRKVFGKHGERTWRAVRNGNCGTNKPRAVTLEEALKMCRVLRIDIEVVLLESK